jgi:hypothetical protein
MTTMKDLLNDLREQAEELLNLGNSKEQSKGRGMEQVLDAIEEQLKKEPRKICYWTAQDVEHQMRQINHDRIDFGQEQVELTDDDKNAILDIEDNFDANYGIAWDSIESAIINYLDEIEDEIETRYIK